MRNTENLKNATVLTQVNTVLILSGTVQHMQRLVNTREILTLFLCLERSQTEMTICTPMFSKKGKTQKESGCIHCSYAFCCKR